MEQRTKTIVLLFFVFLFIGIFFWYREQQPVEKEYAFPSPEDVVRLYFTAWDDKQYPDMYSTIADDFKRSEPTAHNLSAFRSYVEQQHVTQIILADLQQISNDGMLANVTYDIRLARDDTIVPLQGTFVLGNKQADIIRGWKLIHPYGENEDTS